MVAVLIVLVFLSSLWSDESARYACAVTMQAITRRNAEKVKMFGTIALPVAFLGMHEKTSGLDTPDVTFLSQYCLS